MEVIFVLKGEVKMHEERMAEECEDFLQLMYCTFFFRMICHLPRILTALEGGGGGGERRGL